MVSVTVRFHWKEQRWSHAFELDAGATVLALKEQMLRGRGQQQDLDSFELRQRGRRVPDTEQILRDHVLEFEYLGAVEGRRRALLESSGGAQLERQRQQEELAAERRAAGAGAGAEAGPPRVQPAEGPGGSAEDEEWLTPTPAPRPPLPGPPPPRWRVVGGGHAGGILARVGRATTTEQLPERLGLGAVVEEVEVVGERLHYRKLTGAGPEEGWVSLSLSGRELLVRQELSAADAFTLDKALSLQEELMWGFAAPEFQRELRSLIAERASVTKAELAKTKAELFLKIQAPILVKYGFEGSTAGLYHMLQVIGSSGFDKHEAIVWNSDQIDRVARARHF